MAKLSPYESGELTDSIFFIMLVLHNTIHGYQIMQKVKDITDSKIIIGPATMYTTLAKLVSVGWIEEREVDKSKKEYKITSKGREIFLKNYEKRKYLLNVACKIIEGAK